MNKDLNYTVSGFNPDGTVNVKTANNSTLNGSIINSASINNSITPITNLMSVNETHDSIELIYKEINSQVYYGKS